MADDATDTGNGDTTDDTGTDLDTSDTGQDTKPAATDTAASVEDERVKKANHQAGVMRKRAAEAKARADELEAELRKLKAAADPDSVETKLAEAKAEAAKETEATWRPKVVNASARAALASAGCTATDRMLRLIDTTTLDIDDDGEVTGLDDQIAELKKDFPEKFGAAQAAGAGEAKKPAPRRDVDTGRTKTEPKKPLTASQAQMLVLTGQTPR